MKPTRLARTYRGERLIIFCRPARQRETSMIKRRQFLGCLTALGGSYVLSGCGGSGSDLGADTTAVAKKKKASASPNGTTVPPAASIVDSAGNVWTLSNGYIYKNGAKDPYSYNVTMLLWYNGSVYQENTSGNFYQWTGSTWVQCLDPRLGGTSADGTAIPPASYIIDKSNNIWTVSNGYIYKNTVKDPYSYNVSLLLWYGGMIYQSGTGGQFYVLTWAGNWLPCADPRIAAAATPGAFYGMNGHYDYPFTPAQV